MYGSCLTSLTDLIEFSSIMYGGGMTSLMVIQFHYVWQWYDKSHGDSVPLCMAVV